MKFDAVVLAAGSGTRFRKSGGTIFKQIVPYKGVPVIERIVNILEKEIAIGQIFVVLGDNVQCAKAVRSALSKTNALYRENSESSKDNNLISFEIGTEGFTKGVIVVEADCIFESQDINNLLRATDSNEICWANIGSVAAYKNGGVLGLGNDGNIEKIYVFNDKRMQQFKENGHKGLKMFGIAVFGARALQTYRGKISSCESNENKYFHTIAMEFADIFCFKTVEMSSKAFSFNVISEFVDG